ncbi:MAG: winged helix-turn-helix domain-containing protein [Halobacteriales archaeon]|nr:winged helix-turn-helix domain-containing protein [Halobacteriales archaeon]
MARLLPSISETSAANDAEPRVIGVDSEAADETLAALSSTTARQLLSELHDSPAAPSELADAVETSLQNTQYHLENLEDADLIEVVDTVYSEKGREMNVYAPTDQPLVVVAGDKEETSSLKSALTSLLGGLGVLGVLTLIVHRFTGGQFPDFGLGFGGASDAAAPATATPSGDIAAMEAATATPTAAAGGGMAVPPAVLFFAGGAAVLLVGFAVWAINSR